MITDTFHEIARSLVGEDSGRVAWLTLLLADWEGVAAVKHEELPCGLWHSATTIAMRPMARTTIEDSSAYIVTGYDTGTSYRSTECVSLIVQDSVFLDANM